MGRTMRHVDVKVASIETKWQGAVPTIVLREHSSEFYVHHIRRELTCTIDEARELVKNIEAAISPDKLRELLQEAFSALGKALEKYKELDELGPLAKLHRE